MKTQPTLRIYPNRQTMAENLAADFIGLVTQLSASEKQVDVALSGGSTPLLFFKALVDMRPDLDWHKIRIYWVDERCVPPDHPESNFGAAHREFLDPLSVPESSWFRIRGEDDPVKEAARYGELIMNQVSPGMTFPVFDIILLGMGTDGHVASVFPHEIELWDLDRLCTVGTHPDTGQKRVTFTGQLINAARKIIFLVAGQEKSGVAEQLIGKKGNFKTYPASLVEPAQGEIEWYMDREAAGSLT